MQNSESNRFYGKKILSIRLDSGGLSFYVGVPAAPDASADAGTDSGQGEYPVAIKWGRRYSFAEYGADVPEAVRNIVESTPEMSGYFSAISVYIDTAGVVLAGENTIVPYKPQPLDLSSLPDIIVPENLAVPEGARVRETGVVPEDAIAVQQDDKSAYRPESASAPECARGEAGGNALTHGNLEEFVRQAGLYIAPGEAAVLSAAVAGVRAVMKYDAGALAFLREYYGSRLVFYSPLHECLRLAERPDFKGAGLLANITGHNIYMVEIPWRGSHPELRSWQNPGPARTKPRAVSETASRSEPILRPQHLSAAVWPCETIADLVLNVSRFVELLGFARTKTSGGRQVMTFKRKNPRIAVFSSEVDSTTNTDAAASTVKVLRRYFRNLQTL